MEYEPSKAESLARVNYMIDLAHKIGPQDWFTRAAFISRSIFGYLFLPLVILIPITTSILGFLVFITFGLFLIPLSAIWFVFFAFTLGTSMLWINVPIMRPILILPGIVIPTLGSVYVSLMPSMGEHYQKTLKIGLADSWPYSYLIWQISKHDYTDDDMSSDEH